MDIKYHGIDHEVLSDAPFIGALIKAPTCKKGCIGCINDHLKNIKTKITTEYDIIKQVLDYKLNKGIILGGLEWSESPNETIAIIKAAFKEGLGVIIYTHHSHEDFNDIIDVDMIIKESKKYNAEFYIKYGEYIEKYKTDDNFYYGVKLATSNQYIKKYN